MSAPTLLPASRPVPRPGARRRPATAAYPRRNRAIGTQASAAQARAARPSLARRAGTLLVEALAVFIAVLLMSVGSPAEPAGTTSTTTGGGPAYTADAGR